MTRRCVNCIYWTSYKGVAERGQCRLYAPEIVTLIGGNGFLTAIGISTTVEHKWPETTYDDWCGQFEPRDPAPPEKGGGK